MRMANLGSLARRWTSPSRLIKIWSGCRSSRRCSVRSMLSPVLGEKRLKVLIQRASILGQYLTKLKKRSCLNPLSPDAPTNPLPIMTSAQGTALSLSSSRPHKQRLTAGKMTSQFMPLRPKSWAAAMRRTQSLETRLNTWSPAETFLGRQTKLKVRLGRPALA